MLVKNVLTVVCILICLGSFLGLAPVASAGQAKSETSNANGVDIFRGEWVGSLVGPLNPLNPVEIRLYFTSTVSTPVVGQFKASGYFVAQPLGGDIADAPALPMLAIIRQLGPKSFGLTVFANFQVFPGTPQQNVIVIKLVGVATFGGSAVKDDVIVGDWLSNNQVGSDIGDWSVVHKDRRQVTPPVVVPQPTLNFNGDLTVHIFSSSGTVPVESRSPRTGFQVNSNIVMAGVKVTYPDGSSIQLQPYTDVFSPGVNWITQFRFASNIPGLPVKGEPYVFTALDVAGNPIPGVQTVDVWVGAAPPDPPQNLHAEVTSAGILATWDPIADVPDSFVPLNHLGFYQIELHDKFTNQGFYGANHVYGPSHLIPLTSAGMVSGQDNGVPLNQLPPGTYQFSILVLSMAPTGSAGHGFEYNSRDPAQAITFTVGSNGQISIL